MIAIIAWIALAFELGGNWLLGDKYRWGFLIKIVGSVAWLTVAVLTDIDGLKASAILGFIISFRNWLRWGEQC